VSAARRTGGPSRGLGRGLSALLGEVAREAPVAAETTAPTAPAARTLPVTALRPHPGQPRRRFDEAALDELAASLKARGLIQPILVRPNGREYQIVAGERRWRAAQRAGLTQVPVIVRELDDAETLEIALLENIQRQDLNAIEEAEAYRRLMDEYGHTQEALARVVNKSRSHLANLLRLLDLPAGVQAMVVDGRLSMGHARALAGAPDAEAAADAVASRGLSVRDTEKLVRGDRPAAERRGRDAAGGTRDAERAGTGAAGAVDADATALERHLGDMLGLSVRVATQGGGGTVTIGYASMDQLDMLCQRLTGEGI